MAGKTKKTPTTTELVQDIVNEASGLSRPNVLTMATFDALLAIARGIDELRAEAKK